MSVDIPRWHESKRTRVTAQGGVTIAVADVDGFFDVSTVNDTRVSISDIDHLIIDLRVFVAQARERMAGKLPDLVDVRGFNKRWRAMGDSRMGGWSVAQERILAEMWGKIPAQNIASLIMQQRRRYARPGTGVLTLGARGVIIRAAGMGIISREEAKLYAGSISEGSGGGWPLYETPIKEAP